MKPVTTMFLLSGVSLAVLHYLSLEFYLYWRYLWLDIPMHALGGSVVALGFLSLKDMYPRWPRKYLSVWWTVTFVVFAALVWEVFEIAIGVEFEPDRYVMDTISDLVVGIFGGLVGYYVGSSLRDMDHG